MTVAEVQAARDALAAQITQLAQAFESQTGCQIHSLPVFEATGTAGKVVPIQIKVKVQIP
jgi:hypothetical protein